MNIGILVHSKTGHTLSVAQSLREQFLAKGHTAVIEEVAASNDEEAKADAINLTRKPRVDAYDMLVFAAPVRGFKLSPVMQAYLSQLPSLKGKTIAGFVTESFPKPSMGGNQAIKGMTELCRNKGVELRETGIINWMNPRSREKLIEETIERIANIH